MGLAIQILFAALTLLFSMGAIAEEKVDSRLMYGLLAAVLAVCTVVVFMMSR